MDEYLDYYSINKLGARYTNKTLFSLMSTPVFYLSVILGVASILLSPYTFKVCEMVINQPQMYQENNKSSHRFSIIRSFSSNNRV